MDQKYHYIIQTTHGTDKVNFNRLFESCYFGNGVARLLAKISHYVNYYDDVTDEKSYSLCSVVSKNFKVVRVDKYKLIRNNKVDKYLFEETVTMLLECYKEDKKVVWYDYAGFHYFVFGQSEKDLIEEIKNHINIIDTHFFSRSDEKIPSLFSRTKFRVRKMLNVCKI